MSSEEVCYQLTCTSQGFLRPVLFAPCSFVLFLSLSPFPSFSFFACSNAPNGTGICVYDTDPDPPPLSIDDHYTAYSIFRDSTFVGESTEPKSNAAFFNVRRRSE